MTTRTTGFGPLEIAYDEHVLEPRPWTLGQAAWAADLLAAAEPGPLLELCTGAGQIGLAAAVLSGRDAVLVDASEHACAFAAHNAAAAGLADRVDVRHRPMDQALKAEERFALVLADPPYIASADTGTFPADPLTAIDGGDDGLDLARLCLHVARGHLLPGAAMLLQLRDADQAERLAPEVGGEGFAAVETRTFPGGGAVLHLCQSGATG
jgi:release factor glutamine methyltransferase